MKISSAKTISGGVHTRRTPQKVLRLGGKNNTNNTNPDSPKPPMTSQRLKKLQILCVFQAPRMIAEWIRFIIWRKFVTFWLTNNIAMLTFNCRRSAAGRWSHATTNSTGSRTFRHDRVISSQNPKGHYLFIYLSLLRFFLCSEWKQFWWPTYFCA